LTDVVGAEDGSDDSEDDVDVDDVEASGVP